MNRVVHFEIQADQPERAIKFYSDCFGWQFHQWGTAPGQEYWLIGTGDRSTPGIDGGMMRRQDILGDGQACIAYLCTIEVQDIKASTAKIPSAGGTLISPVVPIPTVGWHCYAKDTEGNVFGVMQNDPSAK